MNELVLYFGYSQASNLHIGVLRTPCWPNEYYVGYLVESSVKGQDYAPYNNLTSNYYRTLEEAKEVAFNLAKLEGLR